MKSQIRNQISLALVASALLYSTAFAQPAPNPQDDLIPPNATFMYNVPYGTSYGSDGQYVESGTYYNGAPVYQKAGTSGSGITWSLYKRTDGKWYVDFNTVSEDWDGTVAYTTAAQDWPWSTSAWANNVISFRTAKVEVYNVPYASQGAAGLYAFGGQIYNNAPVYQRTASGVTWSLYKRADGKWYVDFNTVSEDWDGTIAYTNQAMTFPWSVANAWSNNGQIFNTEVVYLNNLPYGNLGSNGPYTFAGQVYNNAPVYQRMVSGSMWSLYKRADGKWYVDFNTISEDWDGTVAYTTQAMDYPWTTAAWNGSVYAFRQGRVPAANTAYWSLGAAGEYVFTGTTYNNAPVYQRTVSGSVWSLYKRTDGKWYLDFNAVSEVWDGTVNYTSTAMSYPWSSATWNNGAIMSDFFSP